MVVEVLEQRFVGGDVASDHRATGWVLIDDLLGVAEVADDAEGS